MRRGRRLIRKGLPVLAAVPAAIAVLRALELSLVWQLYTTALLILSVVLLQRAWATTQARIAGVRRELRRVSEELREDHRKYARWNFHLRSDLGLPELDPIDRVSDMATGAATCRVCSGLSGDEVVAQSDALQTLDRDASRLDVVIYGPGSALADVDRAALEADLRETAAIVTFVEGPICLRCASLRTRGALVLFCRADVALETGTVPALIDDLAQVDSHSIQPILVDEHGTIVSGGYAATSPNTVPSHLLRGHPLSDVHPGDEPLPVLAASGACVLVSAQAAVSVIGNLTIPLEDSALTHLTLQLALATGRPTYASRRAIAVSRDQSTEVAWSSEMRRLTTSCVANAPAAAETYRSLGFCDINVDASAEVGTSPEIYPVRNSGAKRWGIRIPSPFGSAWGDYFFAEGLAEGLVRAGSEAAIYHRGAHFPSAARLDDFSLVLRGRYRVRPSPGRPNVLWIISHPDEIESAEIRQFDLVVAASTSWSMDAQNRYGIRVRPLLQCTDIARFSPDGPAVAHQYPLFVGNAHPGRSRQVIDDFVHLGVRIDIYGRGWNGIVPSEWIQGTHIDNRSLAAHYRGAPCVIADHWPDMAANGFLQNRVYDALACGTPVITNHVRGMDDLFDSRTVRSYASRDELRSMLEGDLAGMFHTRDDLRSIATRVRVDHSFDARVRDLEKLMAEELDLAGALGHGIRPAQRTGYRTGS